MRDFANLGCTLSGPATLTGSATGWVTNESPKLSLFRAKRLIKAQKMDNYSIGGVVSGTFKREGKLTFLKVFEAGHGVSSSRPKVALQVSSRR